MIRTYCLLLLIFTFYNLFSQDQVSYIEHIIESDKYQKRFAVVDGKDYLIEDNDEFTKISIIENDELKLIHKLNYRPKDQYRIEINNYYCKANNAAVFKDKYLVQYYTQTIYLIDIKSGELIKAFDVSDIASEIISSKIDFIGDEILIQILDINKDQKIISLNLETNEITDIDFELNNNSFIIDQYIYAFRSDGIFRYDCKSKSSISLLPINIPSNGIKFYYIDCSLRLFFGTENKFYFIDKNHELQTLNCNIPPTTRTVFVNNNFLTLNYQSDNDYFTKVIDLSNCNAVIDSLNIKDVHFYNIENLDPKFIVASYSNVNIVSNGNHYLINTNTKEILEINSFSAQLKHYNSFVVNNKIYIAGESNSHYSANRHDIHEIDLNSHQSEITTPYGPFNASNIQIGLSSNNNTIYYVAQSIPGESELYKIENNISKRIHAFDVNVNTGIQSLSNVVVANDKFYYSSGNGIYVTTSSGTTMLDSIINSTNLVKYNDFIYALVEKKPKEISYIKINTNNNKISSKRLPYISQANWRTVSTPFGFINSETHQPYRDGFFDFKTEKYEAVKYENSVISFNQLITSKNIVLVTEFSNNYKYYYLFDSDAKTIKKLRLDSIASYNFISLGDGSFHFGNNNEIFKLKTTGEIEKVIDLPSVFYYDHYDQFGLSGDIKTMLYRNNTELLFLSVKDDESEIKSIPYINPNAGLDFFWRKGGDILIANTKVNGQYFTYQWKYGETPMIIFDGGRDIRLYEVIFDDNKLILFYNNPESKKIIIKHYDLILNEFSYSKEIIGNSYYPYFNETNFKKYSDNKYYINFNDRQSGSELWSYDVSNGDLELVNDIYTGLIGSNPSNFISTEDNIYFTAQLRDVGVQWFRIANDINDVKDVSKPTFNLMVSPNPFMNSFSSTIDLFNVEIFNIYGKSIYSKSNIERDEKIILDLPSSTYYLKGTDAVGRNYFTKLIKL